MTTQRKESDGDNVVRSKSSQARLRASRRLCVPLQFLRQVGRDVRTNQSGVGFVRQFQHVANPMNLRYQRRFLRWNTKPRAQPPRTQSAFESLNKFVNAFPRARRDRDAPGKSLQI